MAKQLTPAQVNAAYAAAQAKNKSAQQTQAWHNNIGIFNNSIKTPATGMTQNTIGGGNNQNDTTGMITSSQLALQNNPGSVKPPVVVAKPPVAVAPPKTVTPAAKPVVVANPPVAVAAPMMTSRMMTAAPMMVADPVKAPVPVPVKAPVVDPAIARLAASASAYNAQAAKDRAAGLKAGWDPAALDKMAASNLAIMKANGYKGYAKGGAVKMAKGGSVRSSASSRGDGIAQRGKTRGMIR